MCSSSFTSDSQGCSTKSNMFGAVVAGFWNSWVPEGCQWIGFEIPWLVQMSMMQFMTENMKPRNQNTPKWFTGKSMAYRYMCQYTFGIFAFWWFLGPGAGPWARVRSLHHFPIFRTNCAPIIANLMTKKVPIIFHITFRGSARNLAGIFTIFNT